ncbi:MAG: DUF1801 domain-containing protein [Actinomycetota bacterium]|nr:DUF1801 domain-containing protein [Actinomycetota bacterium]MDD5666641.1 DUF1801 domain-containing protein [Actinomycetota bacterium]
MDKREKGGKRARTGMRAGRDTPPRDVDDYLAGVPEAARPALEKLRGTIKAAAPRAEESLKYQIPVLKYHGDLVGFAAQKDFLSFYVMSPELVKARAADLKGYDVSGATIHFSADRPLPAALVKRFVKARIAENESKAGKK